MVISCIFLGDFIELRLNIFGVHCIKCKVFVRGPGLYVTSLVMWSLGVQRAIFKMCHIRMEFWDNNFLGDSLIQSTQLWLCKITTFWSYALRKGSLSADYLVLKAKIEGLSCIKEWLLCPALVLVLTLRQSWTCNHREIIVVGFEGLTTTRAEAWSWGDL